MINSFKVVILLLIVIPMICWAPEQGLLPSQVLWAIPAVSLVLFAHQLLTTMGSRRRFKTCGLGLLLVFLFITAISTIWNMSNIFGVALSLGKFVPAYLLFLALINMGLNKQRQQTLVKVVFVIFLLQIPVAVIKWIIIGQGESPLGLIGHSVTTYVFLFGVLFLLAYYFIYRQSQMYILLLLGFVGILITGEKRG